VDIPLFSAMGDQFASMWPPIEVLEVSDHEIQPEGIKVRVYKPEGGRTDLPLIVYFHGGGYISGMPFSPAYVFI
jgi:acetyl esterase/lipase